VVVMRDFGVRRVEFEIKEVEIVLTLWMYLVFCLGLIILKKL